MKRDTIDIRPDVKKRSTVANYCFICIKRSSLYVNSTFREHCRNTSSLFLVISEGDRFCPREVRLPPECLIVPPNITALHHPRPHSVSDIPSHLRRATDQDCNGLPLAQTEGLVDDLADVRSPRLASPQITHLDAATAAAPSRGACSHVPGEEELYVVVVKERASGAFGKGHGPGCVRGGADGPDEFHLGGGVVCDEGVVDGQDEGRAHAACEEEDAVGAAGLG